MTDDERTERADRLNEITLCLQQALDNLEHAQRSVKRGQPAVAVDLLKKSDRWMEQAHTRAEEWSDEKHGAETKEN